MEVLEYPRRPHLSYFRHPSQLHHHRALFLPLILQGILFSHVKKPMDIKKSHIEPAVHSMNSVNASPKKKCTSSKTNGKQAGYLTYKTGRRYLSFCGECIWCIKWGKSISQWEKKEARRIGVRKRCNIREAKRRKQAK